MNPEPQPDSPADALRVGRLVVPGDAIRIQYSRSSGPGGQNVNKLSTRAELWVRIDSIQNLDPPCRARLTQLAGNRLTGAGEIHLAEQATRSQQRNVEGALERLRELLLQAQHVPKVRRKTRPSAGAKRRRLDSKKKRGEIKAGRQGRVD